MPYPNFLCIGAQKAGTSWLHSKLKQHPGIWMPPVKELNFFNHMFVESERPMIEGYIRVAVGRAVVGYVRHHDADKINRQFLKYLVGIDGEDRFTDAWYSRLFDRPGADGKMLGEVSPGYFRLPAEGIDYLKALLGDVRIICIVRDPVERSLSQLRMNLSRAERQPANEAEWLNWADDPDIASRSDYAQFLPLWRSRMAPDRILFLPFGDIVNDPAAAMRQVEAFLGLPAQAEYRNLEDKVFPSIPAPIPEAAVRLVTERMQDQFRFIETTFGADFAARTRSPQLGA